MKRGFGSTHYLEPPLKRRCRAVTAFTLIELLIAVALSLVLMLGVNMVFKFTTDTVGTGQAMASAVRDSRAAQPVFYSDIRGALRNPEGPCLIIRNQQAFAFRDYNDQTRDRDANVATADLNGNGVETDPGELVAPARYNFRSHRVDLLGFFARELFRRQTGATDGEYVTPATSTEAFVHYGHLRVANNNSPVSYFDPGDANIANHNNRFASHWILGRSVILLQDPSPASGFITAAGATLAPLGVGSPSVPAGRTIEQSRYDVAWTSVALFRATVQSAGANWWNAMLYRFNCNPLPSRPLTAEAMALACPYFIGGCSQFVVEFAGDFVTQDAAGNVTQTQALAPDGTIDFFIDSTGATPLRKIRWYGLPRDTSGDGVINGWIAGRTNNQMIDVVPLRDVIRSATGAALATSPGAAFERVAPAPVTDYAATVGGMPAGALYTCAWGPDPAAEPMPTMIRLTLTLEDRTGRLADGQSFEYVLNFP